MNEMHRSSIKRLFNLHGKRALVIGGAEGIGFAIARAFGAFGAQVVLADRNESLMRQSRNRLVGEGCEAECHPVDVSNMESVQRLAEFCIQDGGIDIVVNSAAITKRQEVLEMDEQAWGNIVNVNLHGAYHVGKTFAEVMKSQNRGGRMIFLVSTGAYRAAVNFGAYSASKAGVVMLVKTLALELAPYGILVNALAPTATDTSFTADYYGANPSKRDAVAANHPLGRIAVADDYMGAAVYLASEASSFVTGSMLVVDGGKTAK